MPINVLHITPHLGGGVGRVVLNYLIKAKENQLFNHSVICLDYANEEALSFTKENHILLQDKCAEKPSVIIQEIQKSDIILVHWWNHPLLYDFLIRQEIPPSRVIFWSHISGFHPPYIFTEKALSYPDLFVFTTPLSLDCDEVKNFSGDKNKLHTVWSTGGLEHIKHHPIHSHDTFNIGYIGTVDYCKIHPDFIKICAQINIPDVKFIICGNGDYSIIQKEAQKMGIAEKFEFKGHVKNIAEYLEVFDIFGYPLNPYHYGTCDQVLQEAMAAGVVPVVLNNKMEKYMVKDKETGLVANNIEEYIYLIEFLYKDSSYRQKLSAQAKIYSYNTFSLEKMTDEWEKIFYKSLEIPKSIKKWNVDYEDLSASEVFIESLGAYGELFKLFLYTNDKEKKDLLLTKIKNLINSPLWTATTKGTPKHYYSFFKEDKNLKIWSEL